MTETFEQGLKVFEDDIIETLGVSAVRAAKEAMKKAIDHSPSPGRSEFSKGCYILSHRMSVDEIDNSFTFWENEERKSGARSEALENSVSKAKQLESQITGGKRQYPTLIVSNAIPYAEAVETGSIWPKREGYYPYTHGTRYIRGRLQEIVDETDRAIMRKRGKQG